MTRLHILGLGLLIFVVRPVDAYVTYPRECETTSWEQKQVKIVPISPSANTVITVCMFDFVFPDHVTLTTTGNRISATIYDNGFNYSPNPSITVGETLGPLLAGSYLLDAFVQDFAYSGPPKIPRAIGSIAFQVVAVTEPSTVPTLSILAQLLLIGILALFGVVSQFRRYI